MMVNDVIHNDMGGFHKWLVPLSRWMVDVMENPIWKWMIFRGTHVFGNLDMGIEIKHHLVCWLDNTWIIIEKRSPNRPR